MENYETARAACLAYAAEAKAAGITVEVKERDFVVSTPGRQSYRHFGCALQMPASKWERISGVLRLVATDAVDLHVWLWAEHVRCDIAVRRPLTEDEVAHAQADGRTIQPEREGAFVACEVP